MHTVNWAGIWLSLLLFGFPLYAEKETQLFSGGMSAQIGYASLKNEITSYNAIITGLGGRLQFYIGKHFRLGGGGAALKMTYTQNGFEENYTRISYGGLTAEITKKIDKWQLSIGVLGGGGSFTNMHIVSEAPDDRYVVNLEEKGTIILSPIVTIERFLTESISLMFMIDYLWGPKLGKSKHLRTPKIHCGILFNK